MYRRRVEPHGSSSGLSSSSSSTALSNNDKILKTNQQQKGRAGRQITSVGGILFLTCVLLMSIFMLRLSYRVLVSPSSTAPKESLKQTVHDFEKIADKAYEAEREIENEMFHYFRDKERGQPKVVPITEEENETDDANNNIDYNNNDENPATLRMLQQSSTWVDGEKKLKQKLKVLVDEQARGINVGVPVLTRYLGEDIPAYVPQGADIDEWKRQVEEKYAEMREEEKLWQRRMSEFMKQQEGADFL